MDDISIKQLNSHNQIQKFEALNTYNLILNDADSIGYEDGVSPHNNFKFIIPDNQSSHIKNAKVRVKSISISTSIDDIANFSSLKIKTDFLKNNYTSRGRTGGDFGPFIINIRQKPTNRTNAVPEIATSILRSNGAGGTQVAQANDVGSVVSQNNYNILTTQYTNLAGPTATPIDNSFIPCNNPFGKTISFDILRTVGAGKFNLGINGGANTIIYLEVILLPDSSSNDKFNY